MVETTKQKMIAEIPLHNVAFSMFIGSWAMKKRVRGCLGDLFGDEMLPS